MFLVIDNLSILNLQCSECHSIEEKNTFKMSYLSAHLDHQLLSQSQKPKTFFLILAYFSLQLSRYIQNTRLIAHLVKNLVHLSRSVYQTIMIHPRSLSQLFSPLGARSGPILAGPPWPQAATQKYQLFYLQSDLNV